MFNDIGEKIKILSKWTFYIGLILSIILAIIMFIFADEIGIGIGIGILIVGPLVFYLNSMLIFGFGELIDYTYEINHKAEQINDKMKEYIKTDTFSTRTNVVRNKEQSRHSWRCDKCGNMISETPCPNCGRAYD